ncbi:hypothetical protein OAS97_03350 [Pseudomonadales bacterium]|nr:hypothetical protein [Pseudomonadales bacterium]
MNDKQTSLAASHPLDRLSENESSAAVGLVKADSRFGPKMRFGSVNLCAPEKSEIINFTEGSPIDRAVDIVLLDVSDGSTHEVTVSITGGSVRCWERLEGVQPSVILDEFFEAETAVRCVRSPTILIGKQSFGIPRRYAIERLTKLQFLYSVFRPVFGYAFIAPAG